MTKTTKSEKEVFDEQVAKFTYASNSSFRIMEHQKFIKMIQLLQPRYNPPNRFDVAGRLLNNVHQKCSGTCAEILSGLTVCMSLDGWCNVHKEPVICATVTTSNSDIYLVDTVDTSGHAHTSEYLVETAVNAIRTCEGKFGCHVRSFATDANVARMRQDLQL